MDSTAFTLLQLESLSVCTTKIMAGTMRSHDSSSNGFLSMVHSHDSAPFTLAVVKGDSCPVHGSSIK